MDKMWELKNPDRFSGDLFEVMAEEILSGLREDQPVNYVDVRTLTVQATQKVGEYTDAYILEVESNTGKKIDRAKFFLEFMTVVRKHILHILQVSIKASVDAVMKRHKQTMASVRDKTSAQAKRTAFIDRIDRELLSGLR